MVDEPQEPLRDQRASGEQSPWALAGLGTQFFVALIAFGYGGNWLDERFGTTPLFLLLGVLGGGGGSFFLSYRRLMRGMAAKDAADTSDVTRRR